MPKAACHPCRAQSTRLPALTRMSKVMPYISLHSLSWPPAVPRCQGGLPSHQWLSLTEVPHLMGVWYGLACYQMVSNGTIWWCILGFGILYYSRQMVFYGRVWQGTMWDIPPPPLGEEGSKAGSSHPSSHPGHPADPSPPIFTLLELVNVPFLH